MLNELVVGKRKVILMAKISHDSLNVNKDSAPLCKCGCGFQVMKNRKDPSRWNLYCSGHLSPEARRKISLSKKGKKRSKETVEKMSSSMKELWKNSNYYKKMMKTEFNRKDKAMPEEAKIKISLANKGKKLSKEHIEKISLANKGRISPLKGVPRTEELKKHNSKKMKALWADPVRREKLIHMLQDRFGMGANGQEEKLLEVLKRICPKSYSYVGNGKKWIGGKNPDFINIQGQKKVIELFGDYWHSKKVTGKSKKEHRKERQAHFAKYGYKCLVVWEHELENIDKLKIKLKDFNNVR